MRRRQHEREALPDPRRGSSLRLLKAGIGIVAVILVLVAVNGQWERIHRTARAEATILNLVRQQPTSMVSGAYWIEYTFQAAEVVLHETTLRKTEDWGGDDRTGVVCFDPSDPTNQILLHPDEGCRG